MWILKTKLQTKMVDKERCKINYYFILIMSIINIVINKFLNRNYSLDLNINLKMKMTLIN